MTTSPVSDLRVDPTRAALLVVDVQERLWNVMNEDERGRVEKNLHVLLELARRLSLPVVLSEQYPKGLGPTIPSLREAVAAPREHGVLQLHRLEKMEFSCTDAPGWDALANELRRDVWIVAGQEAHVCVYQTARGLCARGAAVHVPADAVISRTRENREVGLGLIARAGAVVTSTEVVVFDALQRAGSDDFRAMSKLVK